ncbi:hypothetical protein K9M78_04650 [Candidatus Bipolaricaulota bacterium]|nr:hypothetical protein [Candidatus Bipolaricaulota bacterium]
MKRLSVLLVGLLSVVLVFSVAGLAETSGTADATLDITDVIDIDVTTTGNTAEITQADNGTTLQSWNTNDTLTNISIGSFTLDLITLSAYSIQINNYTETWKDSDDNSKGNPTTNTLQIQCNSSSESSCSLTSWYTVGGNFDPKVDLTSDFTGSNNIEYPGEQVTYNMQIDPSGLDLDFESGDSMVYEMGITVTDEDV